MLLRLLKQYPTLFVGFGLAVMLGTNFAGIRLDTDQDNHWIDQALLRVTVALGGLAFILITATRRKK